MRGKPPRRAVPALLLALLALVVPALGPPPASAAAPESALLTVTTLQPAYFRPGEPLVVTGRVTNTGREPLRDVELRLRVSPTPLGSRGQLAAVADAPRGTLDVGDVVVTKNRADLAAGGTEDFVLRARPKALSLPADAFGVHLVAVELLAARSKGFGRVALVRTALPSVPADTSSLVPTSFTWVWPLVAQPTRLARDGLFANDSLATALALDGRLTRLLRAGDRLASGGNLTWAIDPELVASVAAMAAGENADPPYAVVGPDGSTIPGAGRADASRWLAELQQATAGRDVLVLPHGDADLNALARWGLVDQVSNSLAAARGDLTAALPGARILEDLTWPVNGYLSRPALRALPEEGIDAAVLDERAVSRQDGTSTLTGRVDIGRRGARVDALLADARLVDLLARAPDASPLLSAQRAIAETAMITAELPSGPARSVVLMPPRRWNPEPEFLDRLVDVLTTAPWTLPTSLPAMRALAPDPAAGPVKLRYPAAQRQAELPESYTRALEDMQEDVDLFGEILTDRTDYIPDLERSVRLLSSSWWRERDDRGNRLARELEYLAELRNAVQVKPGNFTFSSQQGTLALTVVNGLRQPVSVDLRLAAATQRLRVGPPNLGLIGARSKQQVEVRATAVAPGTVTVRAQLESPTGRRYGQPVVLRIRVTRYGTVALYITLAAAAVLFVGAGIQVTRRVVRARRVAP